jgi:hypothetical protein
MTEVKANVKSVKAADPGIGFEMKLSNNGNPVGNESIKVSVYTADVDGRQSSQSESYLVINSGEFTTPITDVDFSIILPFSDNQFEDPNAGSIQYLISVECPIGTPIDVDPPGLQAIPKSPGKLHAFALYNTLAPCDSPTSQGAQVLRIGQLLYAIDGGHFGILQSNGCFATFPTSITHISDPEPPIGSSSPIPNSTDGLCMYMSTDGYVYIENLGSNNIVCKSVEQVPGASMIIQSGTLSLLLGSNITPLSSWQTLGG